MVSDLSEKMVAGNVPMKTGPEALMLAASLLAEIIEQQRASGIVDLALEMARSTRH